MEEPKKGRGGLIATIVILTLLLIGACTYIVYDKFVVDYSNTVKEVKEDSVVVDEEGWEDIALDDNRFYELYKDLSIYTYEKSRPNGSDSFTNQELLQIAYELGEYKEDYFTNVTSDEYNISVTGNLNLNFLDEAVKEVFNKKIQIDYENVENVSYWSCVLPWQLMHSEIRKETVSTYPKHCGLGLTNYNAIDNTADATWVGSCGCTGASPEFNPKKIISAKLKENTIVVVEKAVYYEHDEDNLAEDKTSYIFYSDPNMTNVIDKKTFDNYNLSSNVISFDNYIDKASTITHTFKLNKDTNKYYFVSSEIK